MYTTRPMASVPSSRVRVSGSASASCTVPTSRSSKRRSGGPMGVSSSSLGDWNSVSARTAKRNWPRRMVPPAPVTFCCEMASATSAVVSPSARSRSGSSDTRISSRGAPATATLATPSICSSRRACTSAAVRARVRRSTPPSPVLPAGRDVSASTAMGRSPGSLVSSVGRSVFSGRALREASSRSRTASTVARISVPHAKRAVVVASPLRLTLRSSTSPGVAPMACSMGSATKRDTSVAAAPAYVVRTVSTGNVTSGSSDTGRRDSDTLPSSSTASTAATVATGRRTAAAARLTGCSSGRCAPGRAPRAPAHRA